MHFVHPVVVVQLKSYKPCTIQITGDNQHNKSSAVNLIPHITFGTLKQ